MSRRRRPPRGRAWWRRGTPCSTASSRIRRSPPTTGWSPSTRRSSSRGLDNPKGALPEPLLATGAQRGAEGGPGYGRRLCAPIGDQRGRGGPRRGRSAGGIGCAPHPRAHALSFAVLLHARPRRQCEEAGRQGRRARLGAESLRRRGRSGHAAAVGRELHEGAHRGALRTMPRASSAWRARSSASWTPCRRRSTSAIAVRWSALARTSPHGTRIGGTMRRCSVSGRTWRTYAPSCPPPIRHALLVTACSLRPRPERRASCDGGCSRQGLTPIRLLQSPAAASDTDPRRRAGRRRRN